MPLAAAVAVPVPEAAGLCRDRVACTQQCALMRSLLAALLAEEVHTDSRARKARFVTHSACSSQDTRCAPSYNVCLHTRKLVLPLQGLPPPRRVLGRLPKLVPIVLAVVRGHHALGSGRQALLLPPAEVHVPHVIIIVQEVLQLLQACACNMTTRQQY